MAGTLDRAPILCVGIAHSSCDSLHYVHIEIFVPDLRVIQQFLVDHGKICLYAALRSMEYSVSDECGHPGTGTEVLGGT